MNAKTREKLQLNLAPARISHKNTVKPFYTFNLHLPGAENLLSVSLHCSRWVYTVSMEMYTYATLMKFLLPLETVISLIVLGLEKN